MVPLFGSIAGEMLSCGLFLIDELTCRNGDDHMPFELFDCVRIKDKAVTGTIVDIYADEEGRKVYIVQSHKQGYVDDPEAYNGDYPLYDVYEERLLEI